MRPIIGHVAIACLALGLLSGCASGGQGLPTPRTAAQGAFAFEGALADAINAATLYAELPTCTPGGTPACSDPATVAKLQAAASSAVAAVRTAQAAVTSGQGSQAAQAASVAAAAQAVAQLTTLTGGLPRK